jgi:hypothetical protein
MRYTKQVGQESVGIVVSEATEQECVKRTLDTGKLLEELITTDYWAKRSAGKPGNPTMTLGGYQMRVRWLRRASGDIEVDFDFR